MGRSCVRTHPTRRNSSNRLRAVRPRRALGGKEDSPGWRDAASRGGAEGSVEGTWREPTQRGRTRPLRRRSRRATHMLPALSAAARVPRRAHGSESTAAATTWRSPREGACPVEGMCTNPVRSPRCLLSTYTCIYSSCMQAVIHIHINIRIGLPLASSSRRTPRRRHPHAGMPSR